MRWGIVVACVGLHLVMKGPVWSLVGRMDIVGGSTGWHRSALITAALEHFGEWWLVGTRSTAHWGQQFNYDLFYDVTNQFILEGVRGGVITLLLFVWVLSVAFRGAGDLWRAAGSSVHKVAIAWGLGTTMFVHVITFFGISYHGQIVMVMYLHLAMIGSLAPLRGRLAQRKAQPVVARKKVHLVPTG